MFLYHYYERSIGPFKNLSDLSVNKADEILNKIKSDSPSSMVARRDENYMKKRADYEQLVRKLFLEKGGRPVRKAPNYMIVGACEWLDSWYREAAI